VTEEAKAREKARRQAYYQQHRTEILRRAALKRANMTSEDKLLQRQYDQKWYYQNRDKILAKAKERYSADEFAKERARDYYSKNKDRFRDYRRAYRKKNADKLNDQNRAYRRSCAERYAADAEAIKAWRIAMGYSMDTTAKFFSVGRTTIWSWEHSYSRPPIERYMTMSSFAEWYENYKTKEE
jgi:DNA-binding transcriptional regulator YiaG